MQGLFWLVSRLPLRYAQWIGDLAGHLIAKLPGRYGRRLAANYRRAFPEASAGDLVAAGRSAGLMMMEMPYFWMRPDDIHTLPIEPQDFYSQVRPLREQGRGVIFLTPHLGAYEMLGPLIARQGPFTVLFKPPKQRFLQAWVERARAGKDLAMAPANYRGIRMLLKALRRGENVGILPDQCPPAGEGEWAPFFGREAYTMTLVQRLQAQTGACIVLLFAERLQARAHYRIHVKPIEAPLPLDPAQAAAVLNAHIETLVRLAPQQYLWGYNRYKQPRGVAAPPDVAAAITPVP